MTNQPVRIWYQSAIDPDESPAYIGALQSYLDEIAGPGVRFDVHGISPPQRGFDPISHLRCAVQFTRNAITAEAEGYSAFVIGNFPEPGLAESKAAVDIPVIGVAETSLLHACTLGRTIGLVTVAPEFVRWHQQQIASFGLRDRVVGVRAIAGTVAGLVGAHGDADRSAGVRDQVLREALCTSSYMFRDDPVSAQVAADEGAASLRNQLERIRIEAPSFVILSSDKGPFAVTVTNDLDQPVRVRIEAQTSDDVVIKAPEEITLEAETRQTIQLTAEAASIG